MTPRLHVDTDARMPESIVVLIVHADAAETTSQLRHICRTTNDPRLRYERVLADLRTGYFQHPERFDGAMTAPFGPDSETAKTLAATGQFVLEFDHYSQRYRVPCRITRLGEAEDAWQATYWHNLPFNPTIAAHSIVLRFMPDWERVESGR
jgi:hypothetical protein